MNPIKAVMFDYGLVLCRKPLQEDIDKMSGLFGVSNAEFWQIYEKNRQAFDRGELSPLDYWTLFGNESGVTLDDATFQVLIDLDIQMWEILEPQLFLWAKLIRSKGYKTALLSNMHLRFAEHVRSKCSWLELFDYKFFSAELRLVKPDPRIFEFALNEINLPAREILFIDDRAANVSAARSLGLTAIHYSDTNGLNEELRKTGFPYLLPVG
jgi:putative hydrolase of the HAD superfamily